MADVNGEFYVLERNGKRVNVSEEYSRKNDQGGWDKTGHGYYTLWLRSEDAAPEVQPGAVVLVSGRQRIDKVEKDGKTYTNVNVNVNSIGVVRLTSKYAGAGQAQNGSASPSQGQGGWAAPGANSGPSGNSGGFDDHPPF